MIGFAIVLTKKIINKIEKNKILNELNGLFLCSLVCYYLFYPNNILKYFLLFAMACGIISNIINIGVELYEKKFYKNKKQKT